jgi:hypothetical protein
MKSCVRKPRRQRVKAPTAHRRRGACLTQHQQQLRRAQRARTPGVRPSPCIPARIIAGPVEAGIPAHSGTLKARNSSCAATRAASIDPPSISAVTRSAGSPCHPPPRSPATTSASTSRARSHHPRTAPPARSGCPRPVALQAPPARPASASHMSFAIQHQRHLARPRGSPSRDQIAVKVSAPADASDIS